MASLDRFARRMRVLATRVTENADEMVRRAALVADQTVVMETPVKTGRARSNWIVNFNFPAVGEVPAGSSMSALAEAQAKISTYRGDVHRSIHITNNLVYINRLNQGWSAQAPAGYVEAAVMKAAASVGEVRILA